MGKTTINYNNNTTNSLPDWLQGPAQNNLNWISGFNGPLTPGFNQDQLGLFDAARAFAGQQSMLMPWMSGVNNQIQGVVNQGAPQLGAWQNAGQPVTSQDASAGLGSQFMGAYKDPYENQVVNTTLAGYDVGADRAANAMRGQRDAGAAFGDRPAIADAVFSADNARNRAATEAAIRSNGFQMGAQLGSQDAGRVTQANMQNAQQAMAAQLANLQNAQFNAGISNQRDMSNQNATQANQALGLQGLGMIGNNALATDEGMANRDLQNLATLGTIGDAQYAQQAALNQDPLTLWQMRNQGVQGLAPFFGQSNSAGTQTTKQSAGFLGGLGQVLGGVGGLAGGFGMLGMGMPSLGAGFSGLFGKG